MSTVREPEVQWSQDQMIEVRLREPDDFLKVRETLTRIGVASRKEKKLYQSCHILHKQGRYFIVHFKELFALDGKHANLTPNDVQRRNRITQLLSDWGLIEVVNAETITEIAPLNQIKVLSFKEKNDWTLETKYNIGKKKTTRVLNIIVALSCATRYKRNIRYKGGLPTPSFFMPFFDTELIRSQNSSGFLSAHVAIFSAFSLSPKMLWSFMLGTNIIFTRLFFQQNSSSPLLLREFPQQWGMQETDLQLLDQRFLVTLFADTKLLCLIPVCSLILIALLLKNPSAFHMDSLPLFCS